MVETRQATKETANLLKKTCQDSEVVYVKAGNVSIFRQKFDIIKSRAVNDYHHAHDAYLNIVVGNIYDTKFTKDPRNFIKKDKSARYYNLEKLFEYDVERNGYIAWKANDEETGKPGSIANVKKNINNRNILFTRMSYEGKGELFKVNLLRKGNGQISQKENSPKSDIIKYGGYDSASSAYFAIVEHKDKKGKIYKTIETITLVDAKKISDKNTNFTLVDCLEKQGLLEPKVLFDKIKLNSFVKIDGFYYHLTGRTQGRIMMTPAIQLRLKENFVKYIKLLEKFSLRKKNNAKAKIVVADNISVEKNLSLYDELINKLDYSIYKFRNNNQADNLKKWRNKFKNLSIEDQCFILLQVLLLFQNFNNGINLVLFGGGNSSGTCKKTNNLSNYEEFKLINQSITGLFENEVDLLKL